MKSRRSIYCAVLLLLSCHIAGAIEFSYKFNAGDRYRIISTVSQDIYVNRNLAFKAEIVNRIGVEVTAVSAGRANLSAVFQSAEKTQAVGGASASARSPSFEWSKDYHSEFAQDFLGAMFVGDQYFMPMVRNVPLFPGRNLNPGDVWSAPGLEVHDFRDSFGIERPYRIPFTADYTYLGVRTWKGVSYSAFSVSYRIFSEPAQVSGRVYPRRIQAASDQIVYWDTVQGQVAAYEEYYRTILELSDGQIWEYRGRAEAEVIEAPPMDKEEIARDITGEIGYISDATVRVTDEGVMISLENIQFAAESAVLSLGELSKLDAIAAILMRYPERDILVSGHTALSGTAESRLELSLERAHTVADYLINKGTRTPDRVIVRGYGSDRPLASNSTEAGMRRNRRVEITILEN